MACIAGSPKCCDFLEISHSGIKPNKREVKIGIETIKKAQLISKAAHDKKADGIVIMDMRAVSNITDYFVICSAPSTKRVQTISEGIEEALLKKGIRHWHIEGRREALWVLIDYGDVIAHVFYDKTRHFYNLERLWHDAPKEHFCAPCKSIKSKKI